MTSIGNYINDGASWESQAVLAYLREYSTTVADPYYNMNDFIVDIKASRFENGRDQGYVVSLFVEGEQLMNYAFFEHRNTDIIVVFKSDAKSEDAPSPSQIYDGRDKNGYDAHFNYWDIIPCGNYILNDMIDIVKKKYKETHHEDDWLEED